MGDRGSDAPRRIEKPENQTTTTTVLRLSVQHFLLRFGYKTSVRSL